MSSFIGNIIKNQIAPYKNAIFALKLAIAVFGYIFNHISISTVFVGLIAILLIRFFIGLPDGDIILSLCEKFGKPVDSLKGNVIWVTGASMGIGEAIAYELAKAKCKLVLSARSEDKLQNVKKRCMEIGYLSDKDVLVVPFDMTDYTKHEWAFSMVSKHFGKIDVLVSNAGRSQLAAWEAIELAVDKAIFDLNVFSLLNLSRIVTRHFLSVGGGKHVVISSTAGITGNPSASSYSASKAALHGYFDTLRLEKGKSISVNILCPGPVESNIMEGLLYDKIDKKGNSIRRTTPLMTAERCAKLSGIAMANDVKEAWIANMPILFMMYLFQYIPALMRWICHKVDMMKTFTIKEIDNN